MPLPNEATGKLHASGGINQNKCDSQSALAYNSAKLDDDLLDLKRHNLTSSIAVINYSMGAAITRGWLTLEQSQPIHVAMDAVDTIISIQGAQQGSYLAGIAVPAVKATFMASLTGAISPVWSLIITGAQAATGWDINRPAETDLSPQSDWYKTVNASDVPARMHYFNFYSDIQVEADALWFFVRLKPVDTFSVGDTVIKTGSPDPKALSQWGGSQFLPGLKSTPDRHQYALSSKHNVVIGNVLGEIFKGSGSASVGSVLEDPISHTNLRQHLDDPDSLVTACQKSRYWRTVLDEILHILQDPAHACD
jgi:hypothetical protein